MSTYPPFAIPTLIPTDTNVRATRVSTIYPTQVLGPYTTWKLPVRAATTANITLSGLQTIDGVVLANGDRVLVKNQNIATENGIYVVSSSSIATNFWLRANDLQDGSSAANSTVFVNEGTSNADLMYICTNNIGSDIVGTSNLVFATYGDTSDISAAGTNGNVQYNSSGSFGGSNLFTFSPTAGTTAVTPSLLNYPIQGTVTVGPTASANSGYIKSPDAANGSDNNGTGLVIKSGSGDGTGSGSPIVIVGGSGNSGGSVLVSGGFSTSGSGGEIGISGGTGITAGGTLNISGGASSNGDGGDILINGGNSAGVGNGGNISLIGGNTSSGTFGNITLTASPTAFVTVTTDSINTTFTLGGIRFTKDVGMTIADLSAPPSVNTTARQGIITITDPSALAGNSSITITVTNTSVLANDIIHVGIQEFDVAGGGIPSVLVRSVTDGTDFTIELYNTDVAAFAANQMKISFILM